MRPAAKVVKGAYSYEIHVLSIRTDSNGQLEEAPAGRLSLVRSVHAK